MIQFSVTEIMIVVTTVAVAAASIAIPSECHRGVAVLAAVLIGFTIAGPPLLCWRRHKGMLRDRWGLGELSWFYLGLYFLPLPLWSVISPFRRAKGIGAERWLAVAIAMSSSICAAAVLLGVGKLILRVLGGYESSGREWFNRRPTNLTGMVIIILYAIGGIGVMSFGSGW